MEQHGVAREAGRLGGRICGLRKWDGGSAAAVGTKGFGTGSGFSGGEKKREHGYGSGRTDRGTSPTVSISGVQLSSVAKTHRQ
jgi:hypothetical protein